jgi:hypothetical protein
MADSSGQADIRGLDINKLAKGFAEESLLMKRFVTVSKTKAREVRWYQKTSGFLDSTDTSGITASQIKLVGSKARPVVVEQSWTRQTSYVKKYMVESPMISIEDIKDSDIDIIAGNVRDLVRAVGYQVDITIYDAITDDANRLTGAATADGWNDTATGDPIGDLLTAKQQIRAEGYNPEGAVLLINSVEHLNLMKFLINVKGSSIPSFAADKVKSGVVMSLLGLQVVVSEIATTDEALIFVPKRACTWKQFTGTSTAVIDEPGIGKKIRVWEEGVPLVTDPKAIYLLTDTVV